MYSTVKCTCDRLSCDIDLVFQKTLLPGNSWLLGTV